MFHQTSQQKQLHEFEFEIIKQTQTNANPDSRSVYHKETENMFGW